MPYKDPEKRCEWFKKDRAKNPEKYQQWAKEDRKKNIDKYCLLGRKRAKRYREKAKNMASLTPTTEI